MFKQALTLQDVLRLERDEAFAETVETFISRFSRLQDNVGDKLLPQLLLWLGERPSTVVDNLDRAGRLGWIRSSDAWLETRKLRNQMIHEYIDDPVLLMDALNQGHCQVLDLIYAAEQMLAEIDSRSRGCEA